MSERWEYMLVSWTYSTAMKRIGVGPDGTAKTKRTWKHEFKIARAEQTEPALAWSSDDADGDAETTSLLKVLNKLGGEGWEMISETTPESTIISQQYGWNEVGVPVLYRWMLKRRVGSSLPTTEE